MALENLYQFTLEDKKDFAKLLTENFYEDELYQHTFIQEENRRTCMEYFFYQYLKLIVKDCIFLADSQEKNCIMVVYDARRYHKFAYAWRLIWFNIRLCRLCFWMKPKAFWHFFQQREFFMSRWIKDFVSKKYFHLDLIITKKECRRQGLASRLIKELVDEAAIMDMDLTLETHASEYCRFYEQFGFVLMNRIQDEYHDLTQYCMMIRNRKGL